MFDLHTLSRTFSNQASQQRLIRVGQNIQQGNSLFDRMLLDDETLRERTQAIKEGVETHRERLSSLIAKIQTLQGRLQGIYQSMMDRYVSTNSAQAGTPQDLVDDWDQVWKSVGRAPLMYSRGGNADPTVDDQITQGPDNLGRLHYLRPVNGGAQVYQERGGFYTSLAYMWDWDLHQIRYSYATGTDPYNSGNITPDKIIEFDAIDYNKLPARNWQEGEIIELDIGKVFTQEFLDRTGKGAVQAQDIRTHTIYEHNYFDIGNVGYNNGSGYNFQGATKLYAYVREVEYLPDGVVRPVAIDIVTSNDLTDTDGDGILDSTVLMKDYLRNITTEHQDLSLTNANHNGWNSNTGTISGPKWNNAAGGGWGYNGPRNSGRLSGHYEDHQYVWNNTTSSTATFNKQIDIANDPLRHVTFEYQFGGALHGLDNWQLYGADYAWLKLWAQGNPHLLGYEQNPITGEAAREAGVTLGTAPSGGQHVISSMWLAQGAAQSLQLHGQAANYRYKYRLFRSNIDEIDKYTYTGGDTGGFVRTGTYGGGWVDLAGFATLRYGPGHLGPNGVKLENANWDIMTLRPESAPGKNDGDQDHKGISRYHIDQHGNIYDRYGDGNTKSDHYDYIPDLELNARGNYVGNIFGSNERVARVQPLDGAKGGAANGQLDTAELTPMMKIAARSYSDTDEKPALPNLGSTTPMGSVETATNHITIDTINPQFAGVYMGFAEKDTTTVGTASVARDAMGRSLNELRVLPARTRDSVGNAAGGQDLIDREYSNVATGTRVRILDAQGNHVAFGTLGARDPVTGEYAVIGAADVNGTAVQLDPNKVYTVTTESDPGARTGGSLDNQLSLVLSTLLKGGEYRDALKYGLLEDLMITATAVTPFGDQMAGRLTISYNKRQERVEIFQNAFSAFYKSDPGQ